MKNVVMGVMSMAILVTFFFGCETSSEDPADVNERIKGTWTISSMNMFGVDIPGDGSTLTFDGCDGATCTGKDYEATDETTGVFTYQFAENDTKLVITDEDPDKGGNYNATWEIIDFTSSKLKMSGEFGIFGTMIVEMTK